VGSEPEVVSRKWCPEVVSKNSTRRTGARTAHGLDG
jgi:hypothetical protein